MQKAIDRYQRESGTAQHGSPFAQRVPTNINVCLDNDPFCSCSSFAGHLTWTLPFAIRVNAQWEPAVASGPLLLLL